MNKHKSVIVVVIAAAFGGSAEDGDVGDVRGVRNIAIVNVDAPIAFSSSFLSFRM